MTLQLKWTLVTISTCLTSLCLGLMHSGSYENRSHRTTPDVNILIGNSGKQVVVTALNNTDKAIGLVEVAYLAKGKLMPQQASDSRIVRVDNTVVFKFKHVPAHGEQSIATGYQIDGAATTQPQASTVALAAPSPISALP